MTTPLDLFKSAVDWATMLRDEGYIDSGSDDDEYEDLLKTYSELDGILYGSMFERDKFIRPAIQVEYIDDPTLTKVERTSSKLITEYALLMNDNDHNLNVIIDDDIISCVSEYVNAFMILHLTDCKRYLFVHREN